MGIERKSISFILTIKDENGVEKEKNFEIQLWETAGQKRFLSITKGYYKDSQGLFFI